MNVENEIKAKGLTAPRVTPGDIESATTHVYYLNAGRAVHAVEVAGHDPRERFMPRATPESLLLLTLAIVVLRNGFTVVGKSACASRENYNEELGQKIALDDAKRQMWPLLGYALRERRHEMASKGQISAREALRNQGVNI